MTDLPAIEAGVARTITRYARTVDGRDMAACAALFTEDARITVMGETHVGSEAIKAWLALLAKSPPGIHLTTNTLVEPAGPGRATATSDVAFIKREEAGWKIVVAGQYSDELVARGDHWLFASRTITLS